MSRFRVRLQQIIYWVLRYTTFLFALLLGLVIVLRLISVIFIRHPYYLAPYQEGLPFRIWELLLCLVIFVPQQWTIKSPYFDLRAILIFAQMGLIYGSGFLASDWANSTDNQILLHPLSFIILLLLWITMLMKRKELNNKNGNVISPNIYCNEAA